MKFMLILLVFVLLTSLSQGQEFALVAFLPIKQISFAIIKIVKHFTGHQVTSHPPQVWYVKAHHQPAAITMMDFTTVRIYTSLSHVIIRLEAVQRVTTDSHAIIVIRDFWTIILTLKNSILLVGNVVTLFLGAKCVEELHLVTNVKLNI